MKLSIIIIGDEILLGQVADTNSRTIARTFAPLGWEIEEILTIGDSEQAIRSAVSHALRSSQLVISTGGLGPTKDDITKKVLLGIFGGTLIENEDVSRNIEKVFQKRGLPLNAPTRTQAWVPSSCRVIQNRYGTAPCMWFEKDSHAYAALPGVPFETEGILADGQLTDLIREKFSPDTFFRHASLMTTGISESALSLKLEHFEASLPENLHLAYLPSPGLIRLRLDGKGPDDDGLAIAFGEAFARLKRELGSLLIFDGDATAAEILLDAARRTGHTLASAESCTGGNIARLITEIPGCSDTFLGSVVSYSNSVKTGLLGVPAETIDAVGAVSEDVVRMMVKGVMEATGATAAMATSGIAGPGGGSPEKPVGTVWMAAGYIAPDSALHIRAKCLHLPGKRQRVIDRASTEALLMLAQMLNPQK